MQGVCLEPSDQTLFVLVYCLAQIDNFVSMHH